MDFPYFLLVLIILFIVIASNRNKKRASSPPPKPAISSHSIPQNNEMATFSRTQLIGGLRFLEVYQADLNALHNNMKFMLFIKLLHKQLDGLEFKDTVTANRKIANEFYSRKMNDLYPEVFRIVQGVKQYGKQASAHISIYYAMFVLDET